MESKEIINGNKLIDLYMESKGEYISHKDVWGGEYWGEYKPNNYWSSLDLLAPVIQKIEKEFSVCFYIFNNGCTCGYGIYLENLTDELSSFDLPNWSNNVFAVVVSFLREKRIKTEK